MSILFKIIIIGVITVILNSVLKKTNPEYSIILTIIASVVILSFLASYFGKITEEISHIMEDSNINPSYVQTILKIIAIAYLSEYTASLFYDANESAMGKKIELAGKVIIFLITLPVISSLSQLIISII